MKTAFELYTSAQDVRVITIDKLGPVLTALGAHDLSPDDIQKLFKLSDLDGSKTISFREFLIAIAMGYYLRDDIDAEKEQSPNFMENRKGFRVIQDAFNKIDADHGGTVDPLELKQALFDVADGEESKEILENRFKELDFNGDRRIELPEFVYGFANWVGVTEDADDDVDDPETVNNTSSNVRTPVIPDDEKLASP